MRREGGREGGEDLSEGERGRSVRDEQKPAPSCSLAVEAQEHVSAAEPHPQPGLQDPSCTGTPDSQQVTHLGSTGTEGRKEGRREGVLKEGERGWIGKRRAERMMGNQGEDGDGRKCSLDVCLPV